MLTCPPRSGWASAGAYTAVRSDRAALPAARGPDRGTMAGEPVAAGGPEVNLPERRAAAARPPGLGSATPPPQPLSLPRCFPSRRKRKGIAAPAASRGLRETKAGRRRPEEE